MKAKMLLIIKIFSSFFTPFNPRFQKFSKLLKSKMPYPYNIPLTPFKAEVIGSKKKGDFKPFKKKMHIDNNVIKNEQISLFWSKTVEPITPAFEGG